MSSLLQNVLASRLAQATLGGESSSSSSSSNPADKNKQPGAMGPPPLSSSSEAVSHQRLDEWESVEEASIASDEELIGITSAPGTVPGTPHISRPSSPSLTSKGKRSGLSKATLAEEFPRTRKSKTDPLRSLPKDVSQRIFLSLPVSTLLSLSLVNKRYRRSATLNYCWYRQCHSANMEEELSPTTANGGAKWTRRESKIDWKSHYAKQRQMEAREAQRLESLPGSGATTPSRTQRLRDEGIKTPREMREEEWTSQESVGYSKGEMREWYKSQAGSKGGKVKGKTGKGGVKTSMANDGGLWE